jgi:hypothetical protein
MEYARFNPCPVCGGPLGLLGHLGKLAWFRCRDCGAECSADGDVYAEDEEIEDD